MNKLDPRNIYDDLHQIHELGFEEFKTSAYLADKLEAMGYKVTRNIGGTGVIGEIKGSEPGPVMMLRADMDALPFLIDGEKKNIHACGHDAHSAMLLAAASELVGKVKRGTLRILFQQGEETLKGALAVIDAGNFTGPGNDRIDFNSRNRIDSDSGCLDCVDTQVRTCAVTG